MNRILFCLSGAAWAVLGVGEFYPSSLAMALAGLAAFGMLYFLTPKQPVTAIRGKKFPLALGLAAVLVVLRHGYLQALTLRTGLLALLSLYACFCLVSRLVSSDTSPVKLDPQRPQWQVPLALGGLCLAYTLFFSMAGPLYPQIPEVDNAVFVLIGRAWREGLIPYQQIFDHKGPLIFFIYALGQWIHEGLGVYLLQTLALAVTVFFGYRAAGGGRKWDLWGLCSVFGLLLYLYRYEYGYALTEEFCIPFLMASIYFAGRYLLNLETSIPHPPFHAFLYGITFAVCLMTRVTNALAVCVYVAGILVILIAKGQWQNLFRNALAFLAGFFCLVGPFLVYFARENALYDLLWGTILYNLGYLGKSITLDWGYIKALFHASWPAWSFLLLALVTLRRHKAFSIIGALSVLATWYYVSSGNLYAHYFLILAPFVPLSFYMLRELAPDKQRLTAAVLAVILVTTWGVKGTQMIRDYDWLSQKPGLQTASEEIARLIPDDEEDQVIGYNVTARFYLFSGILPCYKYCILQDWQTAASQQMEQENEAFYRSGTAKWLVVGTDVLTESVKKAMEENYTFCEAVYFEGGESEALTLYKRNTH